MTTTRIPNHPAIVSGLFEPISDSVLPSTLGNQYGLVNTPSFISCSGLKANKLENFQIHLQTNTALTNVLQPDTVYYLSGRLIALNNGATPILTYNHNTLANLIQPVPNTFDFTNWATVTGLGIVTHRQEVTSDDLDVGTSLEVVVTHQDWDSEERCHQKFNVKYVIPGTKYFIKTHAIYQIGREVHIVGRLVDFEMDTHLAVVAVTSVSLTSGHQPVKPNNHPSASSTPSTSGGRQFTTFTPSGPPTTPSISPDKASFTPSTKSNMPPKKSKKVKLAAPEKAKGKAKAISESEAQSDDSSSDTDSEDKEEDELTTTPSPTKRGRPRRDVVKQAARNMKKK
ncbi:hypothetical protein MJO28_012579 [Puccinia striiformis f. sp. tritici]|uniref:Uncharacterized protein n=1 Tax=Puccinia striiformis f. sp. tritici TaxID=168172 RepID=A0ACC0E0S6_9BASI|nr:hypothetical protein MJO28_012579 [Puccinia striiformis f. sp. tritici]